MLPPVLAIFTFVLIVSLDQLSKHYVVSHLTLGQSIPVIDEIFHFTYVLNPGAAFGILEEKTTFFILVSLLVIGAGIYFFMRFTAGHRLLSVGTILIISGAAGNLIDRLRTGFVIDFFDFRIWPVFNIADAAIVTGAGLIICTVLFFSSSTEKETG